MNITSRIESLTVGGQIFITESTLKVCESILRIDDQMEIMIKGIKDPIKIYEVGGIGGNFNLFLQEKREIRLYELQRPVSAQYAILTGKKVGQEIFNGLIVKLSADSAEIQTDCLPDNLANLKIQITTGKSDKIGEDLYAKVSEILPGSPSRFRVHFTAVPIAIKSFIKQTLT